MKLADVKERIDNFFDNITPEELYELSLSYGFKEIAPEINEENISSNPLQPLGTDTIVLPTISSDKFQDQKEMSLKQRI